MRSIALSLLGALSLDSGLIAQSPTSRVDSTSQHRPLVSTTEALGLGLIMVGAFAIDRPLREHVQSHRASGAIVDFGNAFGNPLYVGPPIGALWLIGRLAHKPAWSTAAWHTLESMAIAGGATQTLKLVTGRTRPDDGADPGRFRPFSGNVSFPSGHSTVAFSVASTLAAETGDKLWSDLLLYGAACLTPFARINDDKHWISDAILGAAIGHIASRWVERRQGSRGSHTSVVASPYAFGLSISF